MTDIEERVVRTACPAHCGMDACGILAHVRDGKVVKLEPADFPNPRLRRIYLRGLASLQLLYHPDRLRYPLKRVGKRGEGKWQLIPWDEAHPPSTNRSFVSRLYFWRCKGGRVQGIDKKRGTCYSSRKR